MIRFGIVGTSSISERFAGAVRQVAGAGVSRVSSRDAERARSFADRIGAPGVAVGLDDLLAAPDVDAVYLASPNSAHAAQIASAVDAGIPVLREKPAVLAPSALLLCVALTREQVCAARRADYRRAGQLHRQPHSIAMEAASAANIRVVSIIP